MESQPKAHCPTCKMRYDDDDLQEAVNFATKHHEHTGHRVEWHVEDNDFNFEIKSNTEYFVNCSNCDDQWSFDRERDAKDHLDEHSEYTNHSADGITSEEVYSVDRKLMTKILSALEPDSGNEIDGVPTELIYDLFESTSISKSDVDRTLNKLRSQGRVYQVKDNQYQVI